MDASHLDQVLDKLARDVEASIHAFYRGDLRQNTQRVKTDTFVREARQALLPLLGGSTTSTTTDATTTTTTAASANSPLSADEVAAATRCIMAWMPMGAPNTASPQSRCVPAAREMTPVWGEREKARLAVKRLNG